MDRYFPSRKKIWVFKQRKHSPDMLKLNELLVYTAIARKEQFDQKWTYASIASATGVPERTVRDIVPRLEERGFLKAGQAVHRPDCFCEKQADDGTHFAAQTFYWQMVVPRLNSEIGVEEAAIYSYLSYHKYHTDFVPDNGWSVPYLSACLGIDPRTIKKLIDENLGPKELVQLNEDGCFAIAREMDNTQLGYFQAKGEKVKTKSSGGDIMEIVPVAKNDGKEYNLVLLTEWNCHWALQNGPLVGASKSAGE